MSATKKATMWQQVSKMGEIRHSKQQTIIALHMMARNANGSTEKGAKKSLKGQKQKAYKQAICTKQKIALHKSLKKKQ